MPAKFSCFLLLSLAGLGAAEFFAAPDGLPSGDGSAEAPWDLASALGHPSALAPGDVVWLRGGTYTGTFTSTLTGTGERPIIVRQIPGERVVVDGARDTPLPAVLTINGAHAWFWGLEVLNSNTVRSVQSAAEGRATGIDVFGPGTRLINCIVHDNGNGIGFWSQAIDSLIYGTIVFNNGWDAADRGHGHALYAQNKTGTKRIVDSVFFNSFSHGLHIYGSDDAFLDRFSVEGNIAFNNGILSRDGITRNILLGGGAVARDNTLIENYTYFSPSDQVGQNNLGYRAGCDGAVVKRNYFANGGLVLINCQNYSIEENLFHPYVFGFPIEELPSNTYARTRPSGTRVFLRPNRYEAGRAHIAVFNWDLSDAVEFDPAGTLKQGDAYQIRDLQDLFGEPLAGGIYEGGPIRIPMNTAAIGLPHGEPGVPLRHTSAEFGAFLLLPHNLPVVARSAQARRAGTAGSPVRRITSPPARTAY